MVTAKVVCSSKAESGEGENRQAVLGFRADYDDGRNKEWSRYTPNLSLSMTVKGTVGDLFEQDARYTLQFIAEEGENA